LSESDADNPETSVQNKSSIKREVKLTSEWLKDRWIVEVPFSAAAAFAPPLNITSCEIMQKMYLD